MAEERRATGEVWRVKRWKEMQQYPNRSRTQGPPPWIKLYRRLLDDPDFRALSVVARDLLRDLWLLAAESGGEIPADPTRIAWRLRVDTSLLTAALQELLTAGFIEGSDELLRTCQQPTTNTVAQSREEETRQEEKEAARARGARLSPTALGDFEKLMAVIPEAYGPAVAGFLRAAKSPAAVRASIESYMSGLHGSYSPEIVGRALADMLSNAEPFKSRTLDVFCGDLKRRLSNGESGAPTLADQIRALP